MCVCVLAFKHFKHGTFSNKSFNILILCADAVFFRDAAVAVASLWFFCHLLFYFPFAARNCDKKSTWATICKNKLCSLFFDHFYSHFEILDKTHQRLDMKFVSSVFNRISTLFPHSKLRHWKWKTPVKNSIQLLFKSFLFANKHVIELLKHFYSICLIESSAAHVLCNKFTSSFSFRTHRFIQ